MKKNDTYEDIMGLQRTDSKYPKMSLYKRAAQFAPFAALTGYEEAIDEAARLTEHKVELDESQKELIGEQLALLQENKTRRARFTYFVYDTKKDGGSYVTTEESIKKIDTESNQVLLGDGSKFFMEDILQIEFTDEKKDTGKKKLDDGN